MSEQRCAGNCSFYPACYIVGDCPYEGWKTGECGLPAEQKKINREKWMQSLKLSLARNDLAARLSRQAKLGELDHLLAKEQPE